MQRERHIIQAQATEKRGPLSLLFAVLGKAFTERNRPDEKIGLSPTEGLTDSLRQNGSVKGKVGSQQPDIIKVLYPAVDFSQVEHDLQFFVQRQL
jgi:hypothetical protein